MLITDRRPPDEIIRNIPSNLSLVYYSPKSWDFHYHYFYIVFKIKETLNNSSSAEQRIFCPIRAG